MNSAKTFLKASLSCFNVIKWTDDRRAKRQVHNTDRNRSRFCPLQCFWLTLQQHVFCAEKMSIFVAHFIRVSFLMTTMSLVHIYMLAGVRMSSILRIILTSWVASWIWDFLLCRVSITLCSFMSQVPISMQFTPRAGLFSVTCLLLISVRALIGSKPQFSARASGTDSRASAKARKAYCSMVLILSASFETAIAQEISAAPPPYTTRLSLTRFLTTQRASCIDRLASSMTIILSLVVPKLISLPLPAVPSLSELSS